MKYCVNPNCKNPKNLDQTDCCRSCGSGLRLNNRFRPIEMIGQGGFGRVFKAIDEHDVNKSKCLIKQFFVKQQQAVTTARQINLSQDTILPAYEAIDKIEDIHRQEIEQLNRLNHPQIPKLITHFQQDDYSYLVQEFIEGTNLKNELERQGAFTETQIWQLLHELLPVIKYIHKNRIIHRDIKPENIMRSKDNNKKLFLVDFGAAKLVAPNYSKGQTELAGITAATAIGTLNYIAPEQNNGRVVFASDLYSLGVTCMVLITNKYPDELFDDGTHSWNWKTHCKKVSKKLAKILDKLIEFGTSNRYKTADEILNDIDQKIPKTDKLQSDNVSNWHKVQIIAGVIVALTAVIGTANVLGWIKNTNSTETSKEIDKVAIETTQGLNYENLRQALKTKNWEIADRETYEILLKLGGEESQSKGWINYQDFNQLSCTDLKTIDNLWRAASDGKLGFSSQQIIYEELGLNWQKFYEQIKWGYLTDGKLEELVAQEIDWKTRKKIYVAGKTPNFQDPVPGHLPVTKGIVKGIAFPQFADICQF